MAFHMSQSAQPQEIFFDLFAWALARALSLEYGSGYPPTELALRVSAVTFMNVALEAFRMARLLRWWLIETHSSRHPDGGMRQWTEADHK